MLGKVLDSCQYVVENATHVKINYNKANDLIEDLLKFDNVPFLTKVPYDVYGMNIKEIVNFLLIYDAIDFSFWGNPKWTIIADDKELDGGIALLHIIFNLFDGRNSEDVYHELENMSFAEFERLLKGNVDIPLLKERYGITQDIARIVNKKMNGDFYSQIKNLTRDKDVFNIIIENFKNFEDTRIYNNKTIYFYKLAQLLTSDILHAIKIKELKEVDCSTLLGCADYKIPQVMQAYNILEYDNELSLLLDNKVELEVNSIYEVEIRASMIVVVDYIYEKTNKTITRIDINDFIWGKGQNKSKNNKPYHQTRTTSY